MAKKKKVAKDSDKKESKVSKFLGEVLTKVSAIGLFTSHSDSLLNIYQSKPAREHWQMRGKLAVEVVKAGLYPAQVDFYKEVATKLDIPNAEFSKWHASCKAQISKANKKPETKAEATARQEKTEQAKEQAKLEKKKANKEKIAEESSDLFETVYDLIKENFDHAQLVLLSGYISSMITDLEKSGRVRKVS